MDENNLKGVDFGQHNHYPCYITMKPNKDIE